ncbi:MAG TPA: MoxR family ATPase [Thermoplasmata archaeon]|nr:MoxR family ATPase [Thermoplasmata archaeon]
MTEVAPGFADSVDSVIQALSGQHYVTERGLATAVYLAIRLEKPLLIEGEPGCGKTEIAKALSAASGGELIRLQCYEGLDAATALYEWDYPRQLLSIRLHERDRTTTQLESEIYTERFLLRRPLLRALEGKGPVRPVLLIDELDRADEEFEGLLLEVLSEFQVTVPEIGTIRASTIPLVILTSNRTRELGDAIKRRCLYAYIGYPSAEKEVEILRRKVPELSPHFAQEIAEFVGRLRTREDLAKRPGVAETLDWTAALLALREHSLRPETIVETLGLLLKDAHDLETYGKEKVAELLAAP